MKELLSTDQAQIIPRLEQIKLKLTSQQASHLADEY